MEYNFNPASGEVDDDDDSDTDDVDISDLLARFEQRELNTDFVISPDDVEVQGTILT